MAVAEKTVDKAGWKRRTVHTITCPSGARVKIRMPNLANLVAMDALPEHLKGAALRELSGEIAAAIAANRGDDAAATPQLDEETVKQLNELSEWVVCWALVEPKIAPEDLPDLPTEDVEMIAAIVTRERSVDARGVQLGVEELSRFETFRKHHKCPKACSACEAALDTLSTLDRSAL